MPEKGNAAFAVPKSKLCNERITILLYCYANRTVILDPSFAVLSVLGSLILLLSCTGVCVVPPFRLHSENLFYHKIFEHLIITYENFAHMPKEVMISVPVISVIKIYTEK